MMSQQHRSLFEGKRSVLVKNKPYDQCMTAKHIKALYLANNVFITLHFLFLNCVIDCYKTIVEILTQLRGQCGPDILQSNILAAMMPLSTVISVNTKKK